MWYEEFNTSPPELPDLNAEAPKEHNVIKAVDEAGVRRAVAWAYGGY